MKNKVTYFIIFVCMISILSCTRMYSKDNRFYSFGHKAFTDPGFEGKVNDCFEEYQRYQPKTFNSKTCSKVRRRKCVINKYCEKDKSCIKDANEFYYPYLVKNDEEYCLCVVEAEKTGIGLKKCNAIK